MSVRHASLTALLLLCACGAEEEVACCAIEPKAKCESALHGMGVTEAENSVVLGQRPVCPAASISAERLSELDAMWPQSCRDAGIAPPLIDAGRC
jgi:hypothetical protein